MDWVAIVSISTAILLIIEICRSLREKKDLQRDHQDIKAKINDAQEKLSKEYAELQKTNQQILDKVTEICRFVEIDAERRAAEHSSISAGQRDIRLQIETFTNLYRELEHAQIENAVLKAEKQALQFENQELNRQLEEYIMEQTHVKSLECDNKQNRNLRIIKSPTTR